MSSEIENISPILTIDEAKNLAEKLYQIKVVKIEPLNGFDDKNYHIFCNTSEEFVLKIMNSLDSKKIHFVEAQTEMMLFLKNQNINCSYPIKNKNGHFFSTEKLISGFHVVRLLKFLPGKILCRMEIGPENYFEIGKFVANLDLVLENFDHPAYKDHTSLWMLESVPQLKNYLHVVSKPDDVSMINEIIQIFETKVLENKKNFKQSIIHGDLNEQNIVVNTDENGSWKFGLLDFGDSQYSATIFELALAMMYMIFQDKKLEVGKFVLKGYESVKKISKEEYEVLKVCVAARFCQSLVLGLYTHLQYPDNSYVLTTQKDGWTILRQLWSTSDEELNKIWSF